MHLGRARRLEPDAGGTLLVGQQPQGGRVDLGPGGRLPQRLDGELVHHPAGVADLHLDLDLAAGGHRRLLADQRRGQAGTALVAWRRVASDTLSQGRNAPQLVQNSGPSGFSCPQFLQMITRPPPL